MGIISSPFQIFREDPPPPPQWKYNINNGRFVHSSLQFAYATSVIDYVPYEVGNSSWMMQCLNYTLDNPDKF